MGYYEDKVLPENKHTPAALAEVLAEWIEDLQKELRKASRQIDKLDRKLAIRSRKLGDARGQLAFDTEDIMDLSELLKGIPEGYDFADPNGPKLRAMEYQLMEAEREIDYLRRDERDW